MLASNVKKAWPLRLRNVAKHVTAYQIKGEHEGGGASALPNLWRLTKDRRRNNKFAARRTAAWRTAARRTEAVEAPISRKGNHLAYPLPSWHRGYKCSAQVPRARLLPASSCPLSNSHSEMPSTLLSQPASEDERAIVSAFFGDGQNYPDVRSFRPFLNFYKKEVAHLDFGVSPALSHYNVTAICSHRDIIHIAEILRANQTRARPHIRNLLNGNQCCFQSVKNDDINAAIDLTLRLWLMLNVRSPESKFVMPSTPSLQWNDTATLQEFVVRQFPKEKLDLDPKDSRLSHRFTANFMVKVCGLKLEFTPRLENHLSLNRREKKLLIYPHKACLMGYLQKWVM